MSKTKFNRDQFIDKETNAAIYGDYLPIDIIRNEVFKYNQNLVTIQFILWKPMTEEQERHFLNELKSKHKNEILNIKIEKSKEHYIIETKPHYAK